MIKRDELIKIGVFNKPHGIQGELAFTFTDDIFDRSECPYIVCEIDGIFVPFFIEEYRFRGETTALMKLEDIDTENDARAFVNLEVYFPKSYIGNDGDGELSAPETFSCIIRFMTQIKDIWGILSMWICLRLTFCLLWSGKTGRSC